MKKTILFGVCCLIAVASVSSAALTLKKVEIAQTSGVTAAYTYDALNGTGTISWSGGGSGFALSDDFDYQPFDDVSVTATFWGMTDLSSGGNAKATFDYGTFNMTLGLVSGIGQINIAGEISASSQYTEKEVDNPNHDGQSLDGRGVVHITSSDFTFLGSQWGVPVVWGNDQGLGGLTASVLFDPLYREITDYQQDYLSEAVTVTLLSDDSAIPEPATMALLGLGSLLAAARRRRG